LDTGGILTYGYLLLKWSIVMVVIIVIGFLVFVWSSSINQKITKDKAYGLTIGFSISETYIHVSELSLPTSSKKRPGWTFNVQLYEHDKKIPINLKSEFHKEQFDLFKDKKTGYYIILYG
jgi:hypothetical protein